MVLRPSSFGLLVMHHGSLSCTCMCCRQVDKTELPPQSSKRRACVFSVQCGTHTHFMAAVTAAEAEVRSSTLTLSRTRIIFMLCCSLQTLPHHPLRCRQYVSAALLWLHTMLHQQTLQRKHTFHGSTTLWLASVPVPILHSLAHLCAVCAAMGGANHSNLGSLQQVHRPQH